MSTDTIVNIAAKTDKAGRHANQDNFLLIPDVGNVGGHNPEDVNRDHQVIIPKRGTLLVVADGMGGMSAGEVASQTIVTSLRTSFSDVPDEVFASDGSIIDFIDEAINAADLEVKDYARRHKEARGLGSTIVLAWFLDDKVYCAWCGDSRIYCYNPAVGLERISHDHSYVQALVDSGNITEEEAFTHPDSNIITRSIGDNDEIVRPDTRIVRLREGDTWLLCSDGLCGLLRDSHTESIIAEHPESSLTTLRALWHAGDEAGWSDNCTILLLSVLQLGTVPTSAPTTSAVDETAAEPVRQARITTPCDDTTFSPSPRKQRQSTAGVSMGKKRLIAIAVVLVVLVIAAWWWMSCRTSGNDNVDPQLRDRIESVAVKPADQSATRPATQQARPVTSAPSSGRPARQPAVTSDVKPAPTETPVSPEETQPTEQQEPSQEQTQESGSGLNASIRNQYNGSKTSDTPESRLEKSGE